MESVIEIKNVNKSYGKKQILKDVSFCAKWGKITAFLGPNGAGKSSTLRILLGLDKADSGSATLSGMKYNALKKPLTIVGASFDNVGSPSDRTVYQHLHIVAAGNGISKYRISTVLEITGIEHKKVHMIGNLSLGESQRLSLAAALLGDPQILILDEPTNGLDPRGIRWFRNFIKEQANSGKTILLSSHVLSEVETIADEVVIINNGIIAMKGELNSVIKDLSSLEDVFFSLTDGGLLNE